ncbi:C1 family peptidase [candidate division CSSED10-310 bacterium]|uniref:Aminopeptidase n=1 Tax=candidate division CSSED10-310 bacterium TaxID=2855610 RepID=A0ABV6YYP5_UNCC1
MAHRQKSAALTVAQLKKFEEKVKQDPACVIAMNAVTRGNIQEIAISREVLNNASYSFSHEIENKAPITDQKKSGTCWMYAELNWLRILTQKKFKIEEIEFSQNYLMLWDKLEKANYFLEQIIIHRQQELDDRKVHFLLHRPLPDGGEWHMLFNLVEKYGLVPKAIMPDTFNRENSRFLNEHLGYKLREYAAQLRRMYESGQSEAQLRDKKAQFLEDIYRLIVIFFGLPPHRFNWSYRDKNKKYHQETQITPHDFYNKYIALDCKKVVTLCSCPSSTTPFWHTYVLEFFQNMVGGVEWIWLNVPSAELKKIALKMLKRGEACLFGCDVIQESHNKTGLLYHNLYDYELLLQTPFEMSKADRLDYGQSTLTHSMVLAGVELVNNKPVRWKVENSWGSEVGQKGYFIMSDEWFDEHLLNIVVPDKYLTARMKKAFEQEPVLLPPWHAMA